MVQELAADLVMDPSSGRGRPRILPAAVLWSGVVIGVLRGAMSQSAIWRLITGTGLWRTPQIAVCDQAVFKRLAVPGESPVALLFTQLTAQLRARTPATRGADLAPFATEVVVIDETTLDPVARKLPILRDIPARDPRLLPGKLSARFDVRQQLFQRIDYQADPQQNEKVAARALLSDLPAGSLVLADLGYFGFAWFDDLTEAGYHWISRTRAKVSTRTAHTYYADATTFDGLVWLGGYPADRTKHLVRQVRFQVGATTYSYLTNVRDPQLLPLAEIADLYARRWDIELAIKLVKVHLGLHLLWSAKAPIILHQIWAVLLIAQIVQFLRGDLAARAGVPLFDVSIHLLIIYFPQYAAVHDDPTRAFLADAERLRFIRPARRVPITAPTIPIDLLTMPPPDLVTTRVPRYPHHGRSARRPLPGI